jgi:N-methylhydantoinase A/oxoprolinase/acetone carboxylase beta subunit
MGLLDPTTYFGGSMKLDSARARNVIEKELCTPLKKDLAATIHSMLGAWAAAIAKDLLNFTAVTPDTALIAFGGGGPLAVLFVAETLGVQKVLVPRLAAVFSAYGIGFSDIAHTAERCLTQDQVADVSDILSQLKKQALSDMFSEGFEPEECRLEALLTTETGEIPIDVDSSMLPNLSWSGIATLVVRATKTVSHGRLAEKFAPERIDARSDGLRSLVAADGTRIDLPVFRVELLVPGAVGTGPAVLEEAYWTCHVPSGWTFEITCNGDIQFHRTMWKEKT